MLEATLSLPGTLLLSDLCASFPESSLPSGLGLLHVLPVQERMVGLPHPSSQPLLWKSPDLWLRGCVCSDDLKHLFPGVSADQVPTVRQMAGHWLQESERISAQESHSRCPPRGTREGRVTRTGRRKPVFWETPYVCDPLMACRAGEEPRPQPRPLHSPAPPHQAHPRAGGGHVSGCPGHRVWRAKIGLGAVGGRTEDTQHRGAAQGGLWTSLA